MVLACTQGCIDASGDSADWYDHRCRGPNSDQFRHVDLSGRSGRAVRSRGKPKPGWHREPPIASASWWPDRCQLPRPGKRVACLVPLPLHGLESPQSWSFLSVAPRSDAFNGHTNLQLRGYVGWCMSRQQSRCSRGVSVAIECCRWHARGEHRAVLIAGEMRADEVDGQAHVAGDASSRIGRVFMVGNLLEEGRATQAPCVLGWPGSSVTRNRRGA